MSKEVTSKSTTSAAVNLGDDADTTGAIYGQLAGAYYGVDDFPLSWKDKIAKFNLFLQMAEKMMR